MIRTLLLRVIAVVGYLPNLWLSWLCGPRDWFDEHNREFQRLWNADRP